MSQEDSNKAIVHFLARLLQYKGWIIGATLMSGIAAVVISLYVLKPYYQSFALVYPTNLTMHERASMFSNTSSSGEEGGYYGTKHDANRILTVANSQWLIQRMIAEFNLSEHYGFDKNTEYLSSKTTEQFMDQYQVYKPKKMPSALTISTPILNLPLTWSMKWLRLLILRLQLLFNGIKSRCMWK